MAVAFVGWCFAFVCVAIAIRLRRAKNRRDLERQFITPAELRALMSQRSILIFDIRQPLDLLGESEIITGAKWIAPDELIKNPSLIPKNQDSIIYCTCPSDETGIKVLRRARALHFSRMKLLRGGLDAWKADGYEVVPYKGMIHLETAK